VLVAHFHTSPAGPPRPCQTSTLRRRRQSTCRTSRGKGARFTRLSLSFVPIGPGMVSLPLSLS
jgi:hypothetical protein